MNYTEPNNEFGTHDHEYDAGRFGAKSGIIIRVETLHKDGEQASANYYLQDTNYSKGKCAGAVRGEWNTSNCGNKGNPKYEYRGRLFCGIHFPPKLWAKKIGRRVAWRRKFDADWARGEWRDAVRAWKEECFKALEKIAEGELNDPAGYAQMVLDDMPKEPTHD